MDPNREKKKRSQRQERRVAKALDARLQPNSGARPWSRHVKTTAGGDFTSKDLHVEHKGTVRGSLAIKLSWLERVTEEARARGKTPALAVTFEEAGSRADLPAAKQAPRDWVLLPLSVVQDMFGTNKE